MDKARIRTGWKNRNRPISLEEFANALSSICWRLSLNAARNLHQQDFVYQNDLQRLGVMREYLVFLMHCADRLTHEYLSTEQRSRFMHALAKDCHRHSRENAIDITQGIEREENWIIRINTKMAQYATTTFPNRNPGYDMYRLLGASIQAYMGEDQTNRWVIDQVMDIDGPEVFEVFLKSIDKLQHNAGIPVMLHEHGGPRQGVCKAPGDL